MCCKLHLPAFPNTQCCVSIHTLGFFNKAKFIALEWGWMHLDKHLDANSYKTPPCLVFTQMLNVPP